MEMTVPGQADPGGPVSGAPYDRDRQRCGGEVITMVAPDRDDLGQADDFVDDAVDDDEVSSDEQLLLDRKELNELGLELDNPEAFADDE
jgi:hypothetical protein